MNRIFPSPSGAMLCVVLVPLLRREAAGCCELDCRARADRHDAPLERAEAIGAFRIVADMPPATHHSLSTRLQLMRELCGALVGKQGC